MAKYLLDTHIFIWASCYPERLPKSILKILENSDNDFCVSMATFWEMQIKHQLGKLPLTKSIAELIAQIKKYHLYEILPINETHILNLQNLEYFHKDPFDRIIISQAMIDGLTLLTVDEDIIKYPIKFIN
ncbi:type II toxin-antitoxin system VapC family toxin [Moraxella oblonga]|uniref:type II toxin-antitoxin system VapC family toxin n=1 Tax=Moraxella oblonga TaxID=200413 RepID=UPI00082A8541|nr:type II toxin-antitoxin system VapC family toxin [Moraxella oblonga]